MMIKKKCRFCQSELNDVVIDLGLAPLSNDYLSEEQIRHGQYTLPLKLYICNDCGLIQIDEYEMPDKIFNKNYKYYSSFSTSWLHHCEKYVDMIVRKLALNRNSTVVEIASNDGYLLQFFDRYNIKPVGIEPSESTAKIALGKGIETLVDFFDSRLATKLHEEGKKADLIIGNNVLAHVPDIGDFVKGLSVLLKSEGTITMEFPHFLNVLKFNQFDTIYHEHFSYLTLSALNRIFNEQNLRIYDVDKLPTHGGSLRIYATHADNNELKATENVRCLIDEEKAAGLDNPETYYDFVEEIARLKWRVLKCLIDFKEQRKVVIGYGAAAKGNTLFNYFGIKPDLVSYVVDANPSKQNLFMPGSLIPIYSPDRIYTTKPDYVIIVPWNLKDEIIDQLSYIREWGGKFVTFIPDVKIW